MRLCLTLFLILFLSSCASYRLDEAQTNLRTSFASHDFAKTTSLLEKYDRKDIYRSQDGVLYNLEMGTVAHFNGNYQLSTRSYTEAEDQIDKLFSKSISQGITSFLFTNDNALAYNGESYEDIYLNAFKSLNFMHQHDLEGALVEARRMSYKLSRIEEKYEGMASALSKADTLNRGDWKAGRHSIRNSALSHYLASVLYAVTGKQDNARIEYEKMLEALNALPDAYHIKFNRKQLQSIRQPQNYNVLFVGFAGRAPSKHQNDIRLYLDESDLYLKFSLPSLQLYRSRVSTVEAVIDDTMRVPLQLIEEMDVVAKEIYKVKEPIIYARTFVRSLVKAIGTNAAGRAIEEENEGLGHLVNFLGKVGQEFTEKADLRSWQTMPGKAYVSTAQLSPGSHAVTLEYRDAAGRLVSTRSGEINVRPGAPLNLFETLYWN